MSQDDFHTALRRFAVETKAKHGLEDFDLGHDPRTDSIELQQITVPRGNRKRGVGSAAMADLNAFADRHGKRIWLQTASKGNETGTTSPARLRRFYGRHGFVRNAGRRKDFALSMYASMYRNPKRRVESTADALIGQQLRDELAESRLPALEKKWLGRLNTGHDPAFTANQSDAPHSLRRPTAFHTIVNGIDPTANKQYSDRLLQWYHDGQYRLEDADRIRGAVEQFHSGKHRLSPAHAGAEVKNPKDIGSYPSIHHLEKTLDAAAGRTQHDLSWTKTTASQRASVDHGSKIIHDTPDLTVRRVDTHDAMKVLGAKTKWCVVPSEETFNSYDSNGPLYHIHDKKTGKRALLHFSSGQLMDENDVPIDVDTHPHKAELTKLFHGNHYGMFSDKEKLDKEIINGEHEYDVIGHQAAQLATNPKVLHALRDSDFAPNNYHDHDDWDDDGGYGGRGDDGDISTRVHVASNWNTGSHTLHKMATEGDPLLYSDIASHRNASAETLDHIARHHSSADWDLAAVASRRNVSQPTLEYLYKNHGHHERVAAALADNPGTPSHALRAIAAVDRSELPDRGAYVHSQLSRNPSAPSDVLSHLFDTVRNRGVQDDPPALVMSTIHNIASHRNTDVKTLQKVADQYGPNKDVAERLANNQNTSADTLHALASHHAGSHALASQIAAHVNTHPDTLHRLAQAHAGKPERSSHRVVEAVIGHPATRRATLELLRNSYTMGLMHDAVHTTTAMHQNADPAWKSEA